MQDSLCHHELRELRREIRFDNLEDARINLRLTDIVDTPSEEHLQFFEQLPEAALLMFHEAGGLWRFGQNMPSQAELDQHSESSHPVMQALEEEISSCFVSEERQRACLAAAQASINPLAPMLACAACGYRKLTPDLTKFQSLPLDNHRSTSPPTPSLRLLPHCLPSLKPLTLCSHFLPQIQLPQA